MELVMDNDIRFIAENTPEDLNLSALIEFNMGAAGAPAPAAAAQQIAAAGAPPAPAAPAAPAVVDPAAEAEAEAEKTVDQINKDVWDTIHDLKKYHDKYKTKSTQIAVQKAIDLHTLLDEIDDHLKTAGSPG